MTGPVPEKIHKGQSVTLAEGVDSVEFGEKIGGRVQAGRYLRAPIESGERKLREQLVHAGGNVFRITEHVSALGGADLPILSLE